MKVIFNKEDLIGALTPASGIAAGKNTVAYAGGVLLNFPADDMPEKCMICAYDGEKGVQTYIDCKIFEKGSLIIDTSRLLQIIRSMPEGDIMLTADEKLRVKIEGGSSSFEINAVRGEEFPLLPAFIGDRRYTMPQYVLRSLITTTAFSTAVNDPRAAFNGVYMNIENGKFTCVGCDGNRLAIADTELDQSAPDAKVIVPTKLLSELLRNVRDTEDDVTIIIARKHIIFVVGEFTYFTRMIDSEYIDYKKIIPDDAKNKAFVNADAFKSALERASIIAAEKLGSKTSLKLEFTRDVLKMSSSSSDGSIYEEIPISLDGDGLRIFFNCKYLLEAMRACPDGTVTVVLKTNNPLMVMSITEADGGHDPESESKINFKFGIMPTRGVEN